MTNLSTTQQTNFFTDRRNRHAINRILYYVSLVGIFVFVMFPIFWITISAFKRPIDVTKPTVIFPPTLENFRILFSETFNFGDLVINSLVVCIAVVLITIPLATSGAYALSRFRIPGKRLLLVLVLATQFFPPVVMVLPYFNIFRSLQLLDTYPAIIIVNLTRTVPFAMWLLYGFIDTLPSEVEEAALVD
ncbi:MAG: carbohydrate ABC transporter permease, partial [Chloroflexota bacterium]